MKGFTAIEFLMILLIIGVLATAAIPTYFDYEDTKVEKEMNVTPKNDNHVGNLMSDCPIYPCDSNEN